MNPVQTTSRLRRGIRFLLPIAVLGAAGLVAYLLLTTRPQAARKSVAREARLVEIEIAKHARYDTVVEAMGTVIASRRVDLRPQVAGAVVAVSPELEPGGRFRSGDELLRIDPSDYQLVARQRAAELADTEAQLALEMGNQEVARRESEMFGDLIARGRKDLVLRKPQLDTAKARVAAARAALDAAELDQERTTVRAPFDAVVEARTAILGSRVDATSVLATLVGTDEFWIEVAVASRELRWLAIPQQPGDLGSLARVADEAAWGPGVTREGRVVRRYPDLEEEGRMARLLVAIADPLPQNGAEVVGRALLLGSFVRVVIAGRVIDGVVVDRSHLRDGDNVWLMDDSGALEIRPVQVSYRGREEVVVSAGLQGGERVVASDLAAPVAGMPLRAANGETDG